MSSPLNHVYWLHWRALPAWLRLSREQRRALGTEHLSLRGHEAALRLRWFDAEAFHADCSDVLMVETPDPRAYLYFVDRLRDSPLLTAPYFELVRVVCAVEDGYRAYERDVHAA